MGWVRVPTADHLPLTFLLGDIMTFISFIVPVLIACFMWTVFDLCTKDVEALNDLRERKWAWIALTFAFMFIALQIINPVLHKLLPTYFP